MASDVIATAETAVEIEDLSKSYGAVVALKSVNFSIDSGQYFVLLGPSGGGKTTLLRLIGGFIRPSNGRVLLHGDDVGRLPPNHRPTSMVFQNYALFPHMTVERNVAYGLRLRRLPRPVIAERVAQMLDLVGLAGFESRMPHELSGGQQQRVQLARSLVLESDILLLDEPLAALDAKLRKDMCLELKRIQEKVGITFIHVTHNQEEAMTIADRIAIIADGALVEEGTPRDIYERPVKRFTAAFVGDNNLFDGRITAFDGHIARVDVGFADVDVPVDRGDSATAPRDGTPATVSLRSELLGVIARDRQAGAGQQTVPATFIEEFYVGLTTSRLIGLSDGREVLARGISGASDAPAFAAGDPVALVWRTADARLHFE